MRIFITGSNGQLSKSLKDILAGDDLYLATKQNLDVQNKEDVIARIASYKPDIIFHNASITRVNECFKDPDKAYKVNVLGTKML